MRQTNQILELMDDHVSAHRSQERHELDSYRKHYQKTHERRDFDLYDPNALKKDFPARTCDEDIRCGISGMQIFEGEDLAHKDRTELQKKQMRTWTLEQTYEKERQKQEELDEQRYFLL